MDMATARNIIRGTFRLSVAIAVLAAAYGFYERWSSFAEARNDSWNMMMTLKCGSRLSEETLEPAVNQYGLIDLGKVGCASKQFWASSDELLRTRNGVMERELMGKRFNLRNAAEYSLACAVRILIIVNLLGFAFVALRAVFGWITSGYRPAP